MNDAAREAARKQVKIDNEIILEIIGNTSASVSEDEVKEYNNELNEEQKRSPIGFRISSSNEQKESTSDKISALEKEMSIAASKQDYVLAAQLKEQIEELKSK